MVKKLPKKLSLVFAALVFIAALFLILQKTHTTHFFETPAEQQVRQSANYNNAKKKAVIENSGQPVKDGTPAGAATTNTPPTPYTAPTSSNNITLEASQTSPSEVTVTSKLVGYSDGTCNLTVKSGSHSTSQSAQVIYQPEFSTCAGFSVPVSLVGTGVWNISLSITSGGTTTSKATTLEVK